MNLLQGETRPDIRQFTPLLSDATTPSRLQRHLGVLWNFLPIEDDATLPLPLSIAPERTIEGTRTPPAVYYFTVGFKPYGGETSLYHDPVSFVFKPTRRTIEANKERTQKEKNRGAVALLNAWLSTDEQTDAEHRETLDYLIKTLDQDRPSYRKLFP